METISIKDENGRLYEFKKDMQCELLKVCKDTIIGLITARDGDAFPMSWCVLTGRADLRVVELADKINHRNYDLEPIEPRWYMDASNFPKLMKTKRIKDYKAKYTQKEKEKIDILRHKKRDNFRYPFQ